MAVKYVLRQKRNPQAPEEPHKWYAVVKSTQDVTLKELGREITQRCTVNYADTLAVLEAATQMICEHLLRNERVKLGDIGTFYITIGSEGVDDPKDFHQSMIHDPKVRLLIGDDLKQVIRLIEFEKWEEPKPDDGTAATEP